MKKITQSILLTLGLMLFSIHLQAQDGYTYTLSDNGNYSYTVSIVSNFDTGAFSPITESYGFVIVLPDGVTATVTQYLPAGTVGTPTFIDGADVVALDPTMSDNDLYLITTTTNAATFSPHTNGEVIPLVTLTVNGNPTSGEIRLLSNDSVLANAIGNSLDSFIQADIIDDATFSFTNSIVGVSGLSGTILFSFSTLSLIDLEQIDFSVYPNPASDFIHIKTNLSLEKIELYDVLGKIILKTENINKIHVNNLSKGMYILKIYSGNKSISKKVVIE